MQDGSHVVGREVVLFGLPEQVYVQPSQLLLHPVLLVSTCQVQIGTLDLGSPPPISSEITKMQQAKPMRRYTIFRVGGVLHRSHSHSL